MVQKNKKPKEIVRCPFCKERLDIQELMELGYIEKYANVKICTCSKCDREFEL